MKCAVCVELSIAVCRDGKHPRIDEYGRYIPHMNDAITQIDGTVFCREHAELYLDNKRKDQVDVQKVLDSIGI